MTQYFKYGETELNHLRKRDKKLGLAIDRIGIVQRKINPDLFSALIESIVGQQISNKAAVTVYRRLLDICNAEKLEIQTLNELSVEAIQSCGMSMRKATYIKNISEAAANKTVDFDLLPQKTDAEIIKALTTIKGIGTWTVEMLLIFSLQRPNIVSYGDLAIRRGMMHVYGLKEIKKEQFQRYAKRYAPYGSVASLYLWALS